MTARVVVVGVGNAWRRDDGVGLVVADAAGRRLGSIVDVVESDGEPSRLLEAWTGADLAVVVDAARGGGEPGTVHVLTDGPEAAGGGSPAGSHALGLADAIALGRALDRLPRRLVVIAVEVADTSAGHGLSPAVAGAVDAAVDAVASVVRGLP